VDANFRRQLEAVMNNTGSTTNDLNVRYFSTDEHVIGTCGKCGGPVVAHCGVWAGSRTPPERCKDCGAEAKPDPRMAQWGPVREMREPPAGGDKT
jgi:hypothetical protein